MNTAAQQETADRRANLPPFKAHGITFCCWVTDGGQRYEWRADGGRAVGRNTGAATCWARRNGQLIGAHYAKLRDAMEALA